MRLRVPLVALVLLTPAAVPQALASSSASVPDAATIPGAASAIASSVEAPRRRVDRPDPLLPRAASGREAVRLAGDGLEAAAAVNGMPAETLRALLLGDSTTNLDESGMLFYRDSFVATPPSASSARLASYPTDQTFTLESKPGSQRTIFLDFDGATVSGTGWNGPGFDEIANGDVPGFTLDGDDETFRADEHATIQEVWQRVSEDYAPFDVNVTTRQPTAAQIDRSGPGDTVFGTTAVITADEFTRDQLCGSPSCTGIAYTDVFDIPDSIYHSFYQPAWAFTATYDDVQSIAETVSHEVGHNLGLFHDGVGNEDSYYRGHGNWTPIMGSGFGPVTQWSNGSYDNASNFSDPDTRVPLQDDVALIAANGAPYRADEAGGTIATAASAFPTGPAVIGRRNDVDVFRIGTCTGTVTVTADVAPSSPNLDVRLALLGADGRELTFDDPPSGMGDGQSASGMGASLSHDASTEVLFAAVDGVGNGDPRTGYDDYGSLGRYTLAVNGCGTATPTPTTTATPTVSPTPTATPTVSPTVTPTITASPTASPTTTAPPTTSVPAPPLIGTARPGPRGRPFTGKVSWSAPPSDGGSPVTGYVVLIHKVAQDRTITTSFRSNEIPASRTRAHLKLRRGLWVFSVVARNSQGDSAPSDHTFIFRAR